VEVAKALGGSFKIVTLAPRTAIKGDDSAAQRGLSSQLASNDNLTRTTKRQTTHTIKTNNTKLVPWGTDGRLPLIGDFRSLILE